MTIRLGCSFSIWRWSLFRANYTKLDSHKRLHSQCPKVERKQPARN